MRNEASAPKGFKGGCRGKRAVETPQHRELRRGRLVLFHDSAEYETTRTLAHTSLALAPTMVYILLVLYIIMKCSASGFLV